MTDDTHAETTAAPSAYLPDSDAETQAVVDGFLAMLPALLRERDIGEEDAQQLLDAVKRRHAELEDVSGAWRVDEMARHQLRLTSLVAAGARELSAVLPDDAVGAVLAAACLEPLRDEVLTGTAAALDHAPDPFRVMVEFSKARERHFFGTGFTFERAKDDDHAYHLNVRRCLYHEHFTALGATDLTPIFCAFDANWIDAIDPDRHGFTFERPTTIGTGGGHCPFHFQRLSPDSQ